MEKASRTRSKLLGFLPKAAAAPVTFQVSSPVSPIKPCAGKVSSIIPKEARRKPKNGSFDATEPTSPKVSCVGQIKKKNKTKAKQVLPPQQENNQVLSPNKVKNSIFQGKNTFEKQKKTVKIESPVATRVPSLGQMTRFSSGRDVLSDFDWKAVENATTEPSSWVINNGLYDDKKEEMLAGGEEDAVKPKKEVNLWNRRTMTPPKPLQV